MGEGLLPGGVFRKSAPGEFQINIPGIAEDPVNRIIRNAYRGRRKGESQTRTPDGQKLYPRGFTPRVDFVSDPDNKDPSTKLPIELGVNLNLDTKSKLNTSLQRHRGIKESPLNFFDAQTLQFKHLVEYYDTTSFSDNSPTDVSLGVNGISPETFNYGENNFTSTYLGSFLKTHRNNEDPTILGFDFSISLPNSPLFNGSCEKFLMENGGSNVEISNRIGLLNEFRIQLLSFFKTWDPNHIGENLPSVGYFPSTDPSKGSPESSNLAGSLFGTASTFNKRDTSKDYMKMYKGSAAKAYYLQSITGLDKLSESNDFGGTGKRFIDYGKDFLTLTLNEDVSQNMGYLASLYKNLTWSRERGRMMIPENLLRFEAVLDITEIRNYVRIYQTKRDDPNFTGPTSPQFPPSQASKFKEIADYTSKYRYFIHDCQFFFDKMPHTETINNSVQSEALKGLDLKIYFKHSNMRFMKFVAPSKIDVADNNYSDYISRYVNNNLKSDEDYFGVKFVDNTTIKTNSEQLRSVVSGGGTLDTKQTLFGNPYNDQFVSSRTSAPIGHPVSEIDLQPTKNITNFSGLSDLERRKRINAAPTFADKLAVGIEDSFKNLKKQAVNAGINFVNRKIVDAASLINRTLNQIFNSTPVVGGIKPPKNIYNRPNEWEQAYIDFIGPGLKTFFENPLNFRKVGREGETLEEKIQKQRTLVGGIGNQLANTNINNDLFGGIDTFSNNPEIGNSADPGKNKTLQTIVNDNPSLGLPGSRIPFNTNEGNRASIGNNAEIGSNLKLQDIVDNNPSMGIPGSLIPSNLNNQASIGNNAEIGSNLKLQEIVDNNPSLGLPGSRIPFNTNDDNKASIGNSAEFVLSNLSLEQIVIQNPSLGIPGSLIPSNSNLGGLASLGNNANLVSTNPTLEQIVELDPNLGNGSKLLEGFFSKNPSLGNNGIVGGNLNLTNLVMDNSIVTTLGAFEWDNIQFPNSAQRLPEPTTTGINNLSNVVESNSSIENPELGNSGFASPNNPLQGIINDNTGIKNPFIGNSGELGNNILNDTTVKDNSDVSNPSEGNSGQTGKNPLLQIKVDQNTKVESSEIGNNATIGINLINQRIVSDNSEVINSEIGNSADSATNISKNEIVLGSSDIENPQLGNSGILGKSQLNESVIEDKTTLENPEIGNSGQLGRPKPIDKVLSQKSEITNPFIGNSSDLGNNTSTNDVVIRSSRLENEEIGNSAEFGQVLDRTQVVQDFSTLQDKNLGNSALLGINLNKEEIIFNNTKLESQDLGNSAQLGKTLDKTTILENNSNLENESLGNSAQSGQNSDKITIVENYSKLENEDIGNSARFGQNSNKTTILENYSKLENEDLGNSAQLGLALEKSVIIENNSTLDETSNGNSAMMAKNKNLDELSKFTTTSKLSKPVDWGSLRFPDKY